MNLLKTDSLTSNEIAKRLNLSRQDTRTYLQRLKKRERIKTLGKRGRQYIYTYHIPEESERPQIDTNMLVEVLRDYISEPSFKSEVRKKIIELEAKLNSIASRTEGEYDELAKELEMLQSIEPSDKQKARSLEFLTRETLQTPVLENIDNTLLNLIDTIPEVRAATLVSVEGEIIASAFPQDVDDTTLAVMTAALLSLAESAITLIKSGEFEQLYIRGNNGYLLVIPAGPKAVFSVSTTQDVKLGLIYLDCKRAVEQITKLI
ncbi:MAG: roadblock/LC7 domain-containing protein [Promethearchaeota archaeon]